MHMQAITTKFLPPTNFRDSRVKAKCDAGSLTVSWDHTLNVEENHRAAMKALIKKLHWDDREWHTAHVPNGYVAVPGARCTAEPGEDKPTSESVPSWTVGPGRTLMFQGKPVASLHREGDAMRPSEVDDLAHVVCALLNRVKFPNT